MLFWLELHQYNVRFGSHFASPGPVSLVFDSVAGADTTRTAMLAFVRYVYSHPPTLIRLREEIEEALSAGQVKFPISYGEASRLKFLWACMK